MSVVEETRLLQRRVAALAKQPEWDVLVRYELLPANPSPLFRQRFLQRVGRLLRVWGLSRARYLKQRWDVGLKHAGGSSNARTLLIWAESADREQVREACAGFQRLFAGRTDLTPVLLTDVADFAFYSRLGWLVEYLPELSGQGESYRERKRRYLAWRYRDALVVPVTAGLLSEAAWRAVMEESLV